MQVKKQQLEPCMEQLIGSRIEKGVDRAVCGHPLYLEHILSNARLDGVQAGIGRAGGNSSLRYAGDTTLMAESEEEVKNFLMRVKEESKDPA